MQKIKSYIALLLAVACMVSVSVPASAASAGLQNFKESQTYPAGMFRDVPSSQWYYDNVRTAYQFGLVKGQSETSFNPEGNITLAETITLAARLHHIYLGGTGAFTQGNPWYQVYVDYAVSNGIIRAGAYDNYNRAATRTQFAAILSRAFPASALPAINTVENNAIPDVKMSSANAAEIYRLYRAGILTGNDSAGTFTPNASIRRAEVAAIVSRMASPALRKSVTLYAPIANVNEKEAIRVGGKAYYIGMTYDELVSAAGEPDEALWTICGYVWVAFGTKTYDDFFMAGIDLEKETVVALCASGPGFSYCGAKMGAKNVSFQNTANCYVTPYYDRNDGGIFHTILIESKAFELQGYLGDDEIYGESKTDFYLVNAFRRYHGKSLLRWSDKASMAAYIHSQNMADYNFFDHTGLDGSNVGTRLRAQGVSWRACGENISAGRYSGVDAHDGWVNSAGHRENMLSSSFSYLGTGCAYHPNSYYGMYFTEDFYS